MSDASFGLLRIIVRRGSRRAHEPLALYLMAQARRAGLAGATMVEVASGFGAPHATREPGPWSPSDAVAYEILMVDRHDRLAAFLDGVRADLAGHGVASVEPVGLVAGPLGPPAR